MSGSGSYPDPFVQLVYPDTTVEDEAGYCHRMARAVFNAPWVAGLDSATKAANATWWRYETRDMPNTAVPVWFDHWGTYGGVFGNWGHVVVWAPGHGFLSSPWYKKYGQEWYPTIEAVERTFNATFRFWSEDINGLRVTEQSNEDYMPTAQEVADAILYAPIARQGSVMGGETNLAAVIANYDAWNEGIAREIKANGSDIDYDALSKVIADSIEKALADKQFPSAAEIAKTVNDDVSKRMSA